jgi:AbrB family looped-hinge helix DNA binding protein
MTILATAKVSKGFRVTIPKEARDVIGLEESDEIVFFNVEGLRNRVCFRKISTK